MAVSLDQPVADFNAAATSGQQVSLSALKGQQVVIYFYPKDSTPGCTTEGQGFRDQYAAFKAANTPTAVAEPPERTRTARTRKKARRKPWQPVHASLPPLAAAASPEGPSPKPEPESCEAAPVSC